MVPGSLIEAAKLDGARGTDHYFPHRHAHRQIRVVTLIIFSFQGLWAIGENTYIYEESMKTFNYALQQILAGGVARAGVGAAAAVIMMAVPAVVFLFSQSNVMETMATSGMKD